MAFTSRFSNTKEKRYSINQLEFLSVVWLVEHLEYYIFGKHFTVFIDHPALLSIMKSRPLNNPFNRRLTRRVEKVLKIKFKF